MSDDRLDRELGELFREVADIEIPERLARGVAAIPARGRTPLRPSLRGAFQLGSVLVGGLIVLALAWGLPRIAPAAGGSGSPSFATTHPTNVTTPTSRPCTTAMPTTAPRGTGPTPTPYPATPSPRTPAGPAPTLAPGSFEQTGSLAGARYGATATRLNDGRVLIVGGLAGPTALASAEIYDPVTCRFQAAGTLPSIRTGFTATLLQDGRVLIAGGYVVGTNTGTTAAYLYDPDTGRFSPTGSLKTGRFVHSATLLADGRVLIAGGVASPVAGQGSSVDLASAELFDPRTGTFSSTGSLSTVRQGAAVTLLPNGKVLFAGGNNGSGYTGDLSSAELYDPTTGSFNQTGSMVEGWGETAVVLKDGRVLVLGEIRNLPIGATPITRPTAEIYDPATGKFSVTGAFPAPAGVGWQWSLETARLPDGRVFVLVGSTAQLYEPSTGTFAPTVSPTVRSEPAVVLLQDGTVLIAGGHRPAGDEPGQALSTAEVFRP
jgi:hypothetical protein